LRTGSLLCFDICKRKFEKNLRQFTDYNILVVNGEELSTTEACFVLIFEKQFTRKIKEKSFFSQIITY
jgi:hypothetical protein